MPPLVFCMWMTSCVALNDVQENVSMVLMYNIRSANSPAKDSCVLHALLARLHPDTDVSYSAGCGIERLVPHQLQLHDQPARLAIYCYLVCQTGPVFCCAGYCMKGVVPHQPNPMTSQPHVLHNSIYVILYIEMKHMCVLQDAVWKGWV